MPIERINKGFNYRAIEQEPLGEGAGEDRRQRGET